MKKERPVLRAIFIVFLFFLAGAIAYVSIKNYFFPTPTISTGFKKVEDYNRIVLSEGEIVTVKKITTVGFAGTYYDAYYVIYKRMYIGFFHDGPLLQCFEREGSMTEGEMVGKLDYAQEDKNGIREVFYYDSTNKNPMESDIYIYRKRYLSDSPSNQTFKESNGEFCANFVRNKAKNAKINTTEELEKNDLNYVKIGEKHYFQDYQTKEKLVEITKKGEGEVEFSILSDRISEYPTYYLLYFYYVVYPFFIE